MPNKGSLPRATPLSFNFFSQESKIAEILFLPPKPRSNRKDDADDDSRGRSRISARQQQKRERARRKLREKEAAEAVFGKFTWSNFVVLLH